MRYTSEQLEALRMEGAPVPDRIVAELKRDGQVDEVNKILRSLIQNGQPIPEELPDNIEFWLRDEFQLPEWVEHERLDRASALFVEHGVTMSLILSTASLVECYAARKGVKVLTFSYRLRVGGQGIMAIKKVRLMHSAIRYLINKSGRWDEAEYGVPICQEDMLGTLMSFSYIVVRDLRRLGVKVSDQEAEDLLYLWRVVGQLLGIRADMIPTNWQEAEQLTLLIGERHYGPSPEGIAMTKALLEMHADLIPGADWPAGGRSGGRLDGGAPLPLGHGGPPQGEDRQAYG